MESEIAEHQTKERLRTRWTSSLDQVFADLVVEQIRLGNRPNNIFDKKTWGRIREEFNKRTALNFNNNQLRKHLDVLRTRYNQVKSALVQNDFVMEDSCCIGFDLWDGIGVNPEQEPIKIKDCPIYEQLCVIFADNAADGRYAQSSHYEEMEHKSNVNNGATLTPSSDAYAASNDKENRNNSENKRKRWLDAHESGQIQREQETLNSMAQALLDMIASSKLRVVAKGLNKEKFSITKCIQALDEIEGVEELLYFAALDLFDDPNLRETFMSLESSESRLHWLHGKCFAPSIF